MKEKYNPHMKALKEILKHEKRKWLRKAIKHEIKQIEK